jgi:23S rRNA pseudouridine2605 synthase
MPPRHHYWTIILEGKPTAFRAHTAEELAPTLRQLQARHPDAVMKWFARGRLWESQEQERAEVFAQRRAPREPRPRDWRPGGAHMDPRERFQIPRDEKRRRFAEQMRRDRDRPRDDREERPPHDDQEKRPPHENRRPPFARPLAARQPGGRPPAAAGRPSSGRPRSSRPQSGPPHERPHGGRPHGGRPPGGRPPGRGKPGGGGRGGRGGGGGQR